MNTRENIIEESLNLFAIKGYDSVSIRDIAKNVGIKGSSIYNHFKSKDEIFNSIVSKYSAYIESSFKLLAENSLLKVNEGNITDEIFLQESMKVFDFLLKDYYSVKLRKILTIEQYKHESSSQLFNKLFIDDVLENQKNLFIYLINKNILVNEDPYILALKFYSPVFLLFYKYDSNLNDKYKIVLEKHILDFKHYYFLRGWIFNENFSNLWE